MAKLTISIALSWYIRDYMKALAIFWLISISGLSQSTTSLNMSHDLIAKNIAASNLTPNSPMLDARPLFEAAAAYASSNGFITLTADPGSYYFLTPRNQNTHALLSGISNLTIDWQNSDLYFAMSNRSAITCAACASVTFENFTLDYLQLPFTQAVVNSVDAANRRLAFQTLPGWQSPADFNTNRSADGSDVMYMFIFRNGIPITQVSRLTAAAPVIGNQISITDVNDPWTQPAALSAIQPGDTIVWTDRSGGAALSIQGGQQVTVTNVSIYAAGQIALIFNRVATATASRVQVIPRPGTARLISANADGIHVSAGLANNSFTNNIVRRACDDSLGITAAWLGTVAQILNSTTIAVSRLNDAPFPVGASVSLVNNNDGTVSGTANILSETPPVASQTFTNGEMVTIALDKAIGAASGNYGMVDADASKRAAGSVIAYNMVQEDVFARGIWLAGVLGASVHDNSVQRTSSVGILIQELNTGSFPAGPSSGITIKNNVVDSAMSYGGLSAGPLADAASIHSVAESSVYGQVTTSPFSSIIVTGNRVTNSPRTAIRLENVSGGTITGNTVQGFGLTPSVNLYGLPPCCESMSQYLADFSMAVLTNSGLYTSTPNTISDAGGLATTVSSASYFPKIASGSFVVAYGANLASATMIASQPLPASLGGVTVQVTDTAGTMRNAQIYYVVAPTAGVPNSSAVCFLVPDVTLPGVAAVTIGSTVGTSTGGALVDNVAPGVYTANASGSGVAAALAAIYGASGTVTPQSVFNCPNGAGSCVSTPLSLGGPSDNLIVSLYGTGWRNSAAQSAWARIGGVPATVQYIGPVTGAPGLDQVNLIVPKSLVGAGEIPVILTAGGQTANVVTINLQ